MDGDSSSYQLGWAGLFFHQEYFFAKWPINHQPNLLGSSVLVRTRCIIIYVISLSQVASTSRAARGGGGSFKNRKPIGKIRCCESRNVFVGGNSKTATAVKNLDAITECEAHDYCFANCFQTCQEGPFSVDFTVCSNLGI